MLCCLIFFFFWFICTVSCSWINDNNKSDPINNNLCSTSAQMLGPFILVLRQQQQQVRQVTTIMSRTTTAERANRQYRDYSSVLKSTRESVTESGHSQMKVSRMEKAPTSTGWALGRLCSLTHILFKRFSVSSLGSILVSHCRNRVVVFALVRSGMNTGLHSISIYSPVFRAIRM